MSHREVTSWRETTSARAQRELDDLLAAVLPFAQQQLEKRGAFYPFAAVVGDQGSVEMIATRTAAGGEHPNVANVIEDSLRALRQRRDHIRAGAIAVDVKLTDTKVDAIEVDLEHVEGQAIAVLLPYRRLSMRRGIEYQPLQAQAGPRRIWIAM